MKISYDLHIHSCLSPCGDNDMTPNNILNMARLIGLDAIAISDHNSSLNLPAVFSIANSLDILVVPAIEVCTSEEVHMLCYFYSLDDAMAFNKKIYAFLPDIANKEELFGEQLILDNNDNVVCSEPKLLINALNLSIDDLIPLVLKYNGITIPAHIDKCSNSIISNLGFIPDEYNFRCVELKNLKSDISFNGLKITNSDAHYLENINEPINFIDVKEKSIKGVLDFLRGELL